MTFEEYYIKRLDFNKARIREASKTLEEVSISLNLLKEQLLKRVETPTQHIYWLLSSEPYRMKYAISLKKSLKDTADILGMKLLTFRRKREKYNLID